jgi:hypothetical protein
MSYVQMEPEFVKNVMSITRIVHFARRFNWTSSSLFITSKMLPLMSSLSVISGDPLNAWRKNPGLLYGETKTVCVLPYACFLLSAS